MKSFSRVCAYLYRMKFLRLLSLLTAGISFGFAGCLHSTASPSNKSPGGEVHQCTPCGNDCDSPTYDGPGRCSHCGMPLVKKSAVVFKTIQPSAICNYLNAHPDVVLLDVRTKEEFEGKADPDFGTLKAAVNIPVQELASKLSTINHLKNKEIIVYCSHSHRSPQACYILTQNGFANVTNMAGGMSVMKEGSCRK